MTPQLTLPSFAPFQASLWLRFPSESYFTAHFSNRSAFPWFTWTMLVERLTWKMHDACISRNIRFGSYAFTFNNKDSIRLAAINERRTGEVYCCSSIWWWLGVQWDSIWARYRWNREGRTSMGLHRFSAKFCWLEDSNARAALNGAVRILSNGKGPNIAGWNGWGHLGVLSITLSLDQSLMNAQAERTDPLFSFQLDSDIFSKPLKDVPVSEGPLLYDAIISAGLLHVLRSRQRQRLEGSVNSILFKQHFNECNSRKSAWAVFRCGGTVEYNGAGSRSATTARIEIYIWRVRMMTSADPRQVYNEATESIERRWWRSSCSFCKRQIYPHHGDEPIVNYNLIDAA